MRLRLIRQGDELSDDEDIVVRGGKLEVDTLIADARRHHAIYGTYAISVFALRGTTLDELAQQVPLVRFEFLTLMKVGVIRAAGLRLEPTGRNPRHFSLMFEDLDEDVARLSSCEHHVVSNPYHEA